MKKTVAAMLCLLLTFVSAEAAYFEASDTGYVVETDGEIYMQDNCSYDEKGTFKTADFVGPENKSVKVSKGDKDEKAEFKITIVRDYYEVYYWKNVFEGGDNNARYDAIASGSQYSSGVLDFSKGVSGWESLGIYFCHDGYINVSVISSGNGKIPSTAVRMVKRSKEEYDAYRVFTTSENVMMLKIGSRNAFVEKQRQKIADVAPCIKDDTTFVPIRFITESMKGDVTWNSNDRTVVIKLDSHEIVFKIGSSSYMVDGERKSLNTTPYIDNGRTMVPIRAISEGIGRKVKWDDSGLIVICTSFNVAASEYDAFVSGITKMFEE